ncbi:MAG TPA: S9 family peptidase [Candidatus Dormibacteraeota bacterium]|jgi:dipeptidyl aminopeptidase/acylaminoacyl peptidase
MPSSPFTASDIYNFRWMDHVRLDPSGKRAVYVVRRADREAVDYRSQVYVRGVGSDDPVIQVTAGPKDDSPEWAPDGRRLAYVGKKGIVSQVFVLDPAAGDARQLTSLEFGAGAPRWSPDGRRIAFKGSVLGHPEGVVADPRPPEGGPDAPPRPPIARVAQGLDYKFDGRGYLDGRRGHLFVVSADGGEPLQLTSGRWDVGGFDWSPDGRSLVLDGNAEADNDLLETNFLYVVPATGGALLQVAGGLEIGTPRWSPKGDKIVFAGTEVEAGSYTRLWLVSPSGGDQRCITEEQDICVGDQSISDMRSGHGFEINWTEDGSRIVFPVALPGRSELWSCTAAGEHLRPEVAGNRQVFDWSLAGSVFACAVADPTTPGDLFVRDSDGERRLTTLNSFFADRLLATPERWEFTAADGLKLEGWLLKPEGFDPSRKWPLVMEIHGGPHGEYSWSFFHEFQILAGAGYLVFYVNPRGSCGYGEAFQRSCVKDWGGKDFSDLMTSLDQLIDRTGYVDTDRLGVGGGSYGGFMTNWIVGHTDRFRAAVSMRSLSDFVSDYRACDIALWNDREMGQINWPDPRSQWENSPIRYVESIRTPLLLTHGEMDLRCPIHQAEELFGALRVLRREVELVRFPEETHDLSRSGRPDRRIERLNRIAGWFLKHIPVGAREAVTAVASPD